MNPATHIDEMIEAAADNIRRLALTHPDPEARHIMAEVILCEVLIKLGGRKVVEEWNKVPKWYS